MPPFCRLTPVTVAAECHPVWCRSGEVCANWVSGRVAVRVVEIPVDVEIGGAVGQAASWS